MTHGGRLLLERRVGIDTKKTNHRFIKCVESIYIFITENKSPR